MANQIALNVKVLNGLPLPAVAVKYVPSQHITIEATPSGLYGDSTLLSKVTLIEGFGFKGGEFLCTDAAATLFASANAPLA